MLAVRVPRTAATSNAGISACKKSWTLAARRGRGGVHQLLPLLAELQGSLGERLALSGARNMQQHVAILDLCQKCGEQSAPAPRQQPWLRLSDMSIFNELWRVQRSLMHLQEILFRLHQRLTRPIVWSWMWRVIYSSLHGSEQPKLGSDGISKQLRSGAKTFKRVDMKWRQVVAPVHASPHALSTCTQVGLLQIFQTADSGLDLVQKGLEDYLETIRCVFARFHVLPNAELVEILSQTKCPLRVQPFVFEAFEAMLKLSSTDANDTTEMHLKEGQIVSLVKPVTTRGQNVERWMTVFETKMIAAVRKVLQTGVRTYAGAVRKKWVSQHAGQVGFNASQIHWTAQVESVVECDVVSEHFEKLAQQLMEVVYMVRGELSQLWRMTIGGLVVIAVRKSTS